MQKITPCLWFDDQAEAAAQFYTAVFKDSKIVNIARYGEAGREIHGKPPGSVMVVVFELEGQRYTALNGGPQFKFSEAISLQVHCDTQEEVDYYWEKLSAAGAESQCGWLKDKYGLSWQVVPTPAIEMLEDKDPEKLQRVMTALMQMGKIDIEALRQASRGGSPST